MRIRIVSIIDELEKLVDCIKSKPWAEKKAWLSILINEPALNLT